MHDLSLVQGILKNIEKQRKIHGFKKLDSVEILCGKFNCLSEENLQFCFDAAVKSTDLEGAHLKVRRISDGFCCLNCGTESPEQGECRICGLSKMAAADSNTIYIRAMEVK